MADNPQFFERQYLSQNATDFIGVAIRIAGELADPDQSEVTCTLLFEQGDAIIRIAPAARQGLGTYGLQLNSSDTYRVGNVTALWRYAVGGVAQEVHSYLQVGSPSPDYDALPEEARDIVDNVWLRLADLFDSTSGGPILQTYFQSNFGRNRIAQLARIALNRMNGVSQPAQSYTLTGAKQTQIFPYTKWSAALEQSLYVETLKHLVRSYVEQPDNIGVRISYQDRRDYMQRWQAVLDEEQKTLDSMLGVYKIAFMPLGIGHALVSGGAYGRYGRGSGVYGGGEWRNPRGW